MIETINDLKKLSEEEAQAIASSISLKSVAYNQMKKSGKSTGLTKEEWTAAYANRQAHKCPTCRGKGEVIPPMRTVGTIHPSSASSCTAKLYYDVTGEIAPNTEFSPELQITFDIGHAIHTRVQSALRDTLKDNFQEEVRVDLPEALIIGGSADGLLRYMDVARVLLEIKTISPDEFEKLRKPKSEHLIQAAGIYAKALDAPFISFLYISKIWPHSMKEYVVPYDEKVFTKWWLEKGIKVDAALEAGRPPTADANKYDCRSCGYIHACPQALGLKDRFRR